jgi:hypothetical protein
MYAFIRNAGTALAGVVLVGAGLFVALPATGAHAAASEAAPAACAETARGWACYLVPNSCYPIPGGYRCLYDCYPTAAARAAGVAPSRQVTRDVASEAAAPKQISTP